MARIRITKNLMDQDEETIRQRLYPGEVQARLASRAYYRREDAELVIPVLKDWVSGICDAGIEASRAFDDHLYRDTYFDVNGWP
jgi:hypothetical protein